MKFRTGLRIAAAGLLLAACGTGIFLYFRAAKETDPVSADSPRSEAAADTTSPAQEEEPPEPIYEDIPADLLRVSGISPQAETDLDYVDWWYSEWEDCRYIFLPATADRKALTLSYRADAPLALNGTEILSGKQTDLLSTADEFTVTVGKEDCGTLRILQSTLPVVYLTADAAGGLDYLDEHKEAACTGSILMLNADGSVDYEGSIAKLSAHGNSSWDYSTKKPYNIKLDEKASIYGMGKAKKWVFLSNFLDHSHLRNTLADAMSRQAKLAYTMNCVFVDLYAEGSYRGTYQIYEKIEVQKNRISITDLEKATEQVNDEPLSAYPQRIAGAYDEEYHLGCCRYYDIPHDPADITGGYLVQFQLYNRYPRHTKSGFVTSRGQAVELESPEYASKAQVLYIRQFMQDLEDAIYSEDGFNDKGKHYSEYIDVDSLVLGYLIQEITENADGSYTSFYFWKESDSAGDGKLHYGPVWDFDLAYCNFSRAVTAADGVTRYSAHTGELYAAFMPISGYDVTGESDRTALGENWLMKLWQKEEFRGRAIELYFDVFDEFLAKLADPEQKGGDLVTKMAEPLTASAIMNNARWHTYGGKDYKPLGPLNGNDYPECVEYVRSFLMKRRSVLREIYFNEGRQILQDLFDAALENIDYERYDEESRAAIETILSETAYAIESIPDYEEARKMLDDSLGRLDDLPQTDPPEQPDEPEEPHTEPHTEPRTEPHTEAQTETSANPHTEIHTEIHTIGGEEP